MPRLRMALGGAAEGLSDMLKNKIKNDDLQGRADKLQAAENARQFLSQRNTDLKDLIDKIAANPERFDLLKAGATQNPALAGVDLEKMRPPDINLASPVINQIGSAKSPLDLPPDIGLALQQKGVKDTKPGIPLGNTAQFGSQADYAGASPVQNQAMNLASTRLGQLGEEKETGFQDAARKTREEAFGRKTGEMTAEHNGATTASMDAAFRNSLLKQGDQDVLNNPTNVTGAANRAGAIKGSEEKASQPFEMERIRTRAQVEAENQKSMELWKVQHIPTAFSRNMMEMSQMLLNQNKPQNLQTMAKILQDNNLFGPLGSRLRDAAEKIGTAEFLTKLDAVEDPDTAARMVMSEIGKVEPQLMSDRLVGQFSTDLSLLASGLARAHFGGRSGAATLGYMKDMLSATATPELFAGRMIEAEKLLKGYAAGPFAAPDEPMKPGDFFRQPTTDPNLKSAQDKLNAR